MFFYHYIRGIDLVFGVKEHFDKLGLNLILIT